MRFERNAATVTAGCCEASHTRAGASVQCCCSCIFLIHFSRIRRTPSCPKSSDDLHQVGPSDIVIESYGNPFFLPSLARLWQHQVGYRFDASGERVEDWSSNWIVVADEGADPFIYDASTAEILFANHGAGTWKPVEAYPDLNTMAACMAIFGIVSIQAGENFTDEQSYVSPEHRAEAVSRLLEVLADKEAAEAIIVNAGWG
jgi:hypothetical protein